MKISSSGVREEGTDETCRRQNEGTFVTDWVQCWRKGSAMTPQCPPGTQSYTFVPPEHLVQQPPHSKNSMWLNEQRNEWNHILFSETTDPVFYRTKGLILLCLLSMPQGKRCHHHLKQKRVKNPSQRPKPKDNAEGVGHSFLSYEFQNGHNTSSKGWYQQIKAMVNKNRIHQIKITTFPNLFPSLAHRKPLSIANQAKGKTKKPQILIQHLAVSP